MSSFYKIVVFIAMGIAFNLSLSGCASGPTPIAELGLYAYEGDSVQFNPRVPFVPFTGGERRVDPENLRHVAKQNSTRSKSMSTRH